MRLAHKCQEWNDLVHVTVSGLYCATAAVSRRLSPYISVNMSGVHSIKVQI